MKAVLSILLVAVLFTACQNSSKESATKQSGKKVAITGAGATFPLPFYNMVFDKYSKESGILVTYGGIGSGGGIRSITDKVVDFGASDAYLDDKQMAEMPAPIVHIPTCIGAVVIAYNLPGIDELKLSNQLLEKIFLGEIKKWNDPAIKANNPGVDLPNLGITFVYRSDGSGTTHIFSDYMSKISSKWNEKVGTGKALQWPVGMGAKGNPGVAGTVQQTNGAIGYIGSEFAFAQKIQIAKIENSAGAYVLPTIETISASAKTSLPDDTRIMLTNSSDPNAYPISGFTWIILYKDQAYNNRSEAQALETVKMLDWLMGNSGQGVAASVNYAPLPEQAVDKAKQILRTITYNGNQLLK